jgi:hypothetical protein
MRVVEVAVLVPNGDMPDSMWVCVDGQSCMLSRTFPDLR